MNDTREVALSDGTSLHGNQVGAPTGCDATRAPSSSSSQPIVPHRDRRGRGAPAYATVTSKLCPAPSDDGSTTRSLRTLCWNAAVRELTLTLVARTPIRSNESVLVAISERPRITAMPLRRFVLTL